MGLVLYLLSLAISVALIVHCFKTGRNSLWIMALMFLPVAGAIAYVIVEILPDLRRSRTVRNAARGVQRTLDPERDLRQLEGMANVSSDVASQQSYADELVKLGRPIEAVEVYRRCLTGLFDNDPKLLQGLACAQFAAGDATGTRTTLDQLIEHNPQHQSPDGHLLYARALEAEGNATKALEEYAVLADYYPGAEAAVRYAQLLTKQGNGADAQRILGDLLARARIAPAHYRNAQREWLAIAEREQRAR